MIDFSNARFVKLSKCTNEEVMPTVSPFFVEGEQVMIAAKGSRDFIVFTTKRIIAVNFQGITGKKVDISSLPYTKIQAFSVETAGTFDRDAELQLYMSGLGKVALEFSGSFDVGYVNRLISHYVL